MQEFCILRPSAHTVNLLNKVQACILNTCLQVRKCMYKYLCNTLECTQSKRLKCFAQQIVGECPSYKYTYVFSRVD